MKTPSPCSAFGLSILWGALLPFSILPAYSGGHDFSSLLAKKFAPWSYQEKFRSIELELPGIPGESYHIQPVDVLPEELGRKYPEIVTYMGVGEKFSDHRVAITLYKNSLYITRLAGSVQEDFESRNMGVLVRKLPLRPATQFSDVALASIKTSSPIASPLAKVSTNPPDCIGSAAPCYTMGDTLFVFRWAIALEGTTNQRVADGTVAGGLAWVTAMVNRMNLIWMRDLSSRMVLPLNADRLIFTTANNGIFPSPPVTTNTLIGFVDTTMNQVLGRGNWEYGYIVSDGLGGGLAGGTHGVGTPDYDIFIHEIGHQWGSPHNLTLEGPADGWSIGGTIMGNRGNTVLTTDSVLNGDSYSSHSIAQGFVDLKTSSASSWRRGYQRIATGNRIPQITVLASGFVIPINTPFVLSGTATDADGDNLTYAWEHSDKSTVTYDPAVFFPPDNGPLFVSVYPTPGGHTRYFPNLRDLLNNQVDTTLERLPFASRALNFRLVVRDNNPNSGAVNWQNVSFSSDAGAGPFRVTTLNQTGQIRTGGSALPITWDVAGTNNVQVNCQQVNILLSTDGGLNYNRVMANGVPNSGQYTATLPNLPGTNNRIMVKAANNIFFDINDSPFEIFDSTRAGYQLSITSSRLNIGLVTSGTIDYSVFGIGSNLGALTLTLAGAPAGLNLSFQQGGQSLTVTDSVRSRLNWSIPATLAKGRYPITLSVHGPRTDTVLRFTVVKSGPISSVPGMAARLLGANTDTHILLPTLAEKPVSNFTFMAIVRRRGVQEDIAALFSTMAKGGGNGLALNTDSVGNLLMHWNGSHWWQKSGLVLPDNQWAKVALVVQPGKAQIWLNQNVFEINSNEPALSLDSAIWIGAHFGLWYRNFNGDVDEVTLWDRSLSAVEINYFQNNHPTGDEIGLLRYHQFDGNTVDALEGQDAVWNKPPQAQYVGADYVYSPVLGNTVKNNESFSLNKTPLGWVLTFQSYHKAVLEYQITDVRGTVLIRSRENGEPGRHRVEIPIPALTQSRGILFLSASLGEKRITRRMVLLP